MRSERNVTKSEQKQVFRNAVEILYEFRSVLPDRLIFKDNFYVAVVFKEKVMATLIFKLHPTATTVYAEITLAATHPLHRRKGALRALMVQLEKVLKKLKVNKFILPSLPRSIYIWHQKIGFATVPSWELTLL
jgi:N-acetylglutamate synthase-like GNAT family acetyltransferase